MSNGLKKFIHRKRDRRDLQIFIQIISELLKTISDAQVELQRNHYEERQYDDLLITINHQFHEYLKLYMNHRYAKPSQILSAGQIMRSLENIHNSINEFKTMLRNLIRDMTSNTVEEYDIHSLSPEDYRKIRRPYVETMHSFSVAILNVSNKIFLLITYDLCRLKTGSDIIADYYNSSGPPKIKVSYNASLSKEDVLKKIDEISESSDNINNKSSRKEERK